ncbi:hypothetical protein GA0115260_111833 [Streptomyces sp. MnatMP-M27]|nr:hypothetical protein GA0115260_111833 [Streptomyces sp. MnatMP-M27]
MICGTASASAWTALAPANASSRFRRSAGGPGSIQEVAPRAARLPSARHGSIVAGTSSVIHHGVFRDEDGLTDPPTLDPVKPPGITAREVSVGLDVPRRHWIGRADGSLLSADR